MIWGADFDFSDFGYDGEGIVSSFGCPNCPATAEVTYACEKEVTK
jgi:hypothetical protein